MKLIVIDELYYLPLLPRDTFDDIDPVSFQLGSQLFSTFQIESHHYKPLLFTPLNVYNLVINGYHSLWKLMDDLNLIGWLFNDDNDGH